MAKFIGAALVISASSLMGLMAAQGFNRRSRLLRTWLRVMEIFQTEIYQQARFLPEVLERTARLTPDRELADGFISLAAQIQFGAGTGITELWESFLVDSNKGVLARADLQILCELGSYLGSTGREDQLNKIKICKAGLEYNLQLAEEERKKRSGVYRYLGFASGAMLVLWLL